MKYKIITTLENGQPKLPPMQADGGYCLTYTEAGILRGGFSLLSEAPTEPNTVMVLVECSQAVFEQMMDDPALDLAPWWEVVDEKEI